MKFYHSLNIISIMKVLIVALVLTTVLARNIFLEQQPIIEFINNL